MSLYITFSDFGKNVEVRRGERLSHNGSNESDHRYCNADAQATLRCLLITSCPDGCTHKNREKFEFFLQNNDEQWLVQMLVITLRHSSDQKQRLRSAIMLGKIGGDQAKYELASVLGNTSSDLHWAAVDALRKLGCGKLLTDWSYR